MKHYTKMKQPLRWRMAVLVELGCVSVFSAELSNARRSCSGRLLTLPFHCFRRGSILMRSTCRPPAGYCIPPDDSCSKQVYVISQPSCRVRLCFRPVPASKPLRSRVLPNHTTSKFDAALLQASASHLRSALLLPDGSCLRPLATFILQRLRQSFSSSGSGIYPRRWNMPPGHQASKPSGGRLWPRDTESLSSSDVAAKGASPPRSHACPQSVRLRLSKTSSEGRAQRRIHLCRGSFGTVCFSLQLFVKVSYKQCSVLPWFGDGDAGMSMYERGFQERVCRCCARLPCIVISL